MNLSNYYWYFQSVIPKKICDDILKYGKEKQKSLALVGSHSKRNLLKDPLSKKEIKDLKKKRNSEVCWLNDKWIYDQIHPYVNQANRNAGWNFEWDYSESCQFTKYSTNEYYGWHCDSEKKPYNNPENINFHNKIRKLSVTCSLSDPSEYEGGELEFNFNDPGFSKKDNIKKCKEILPRGSIVVFPSFVWHRVCPVKKGTRYSLVVWNLGYPYR